MLIEGDHGQCGGLGGCDRGAEVDPVAPGVVSQYSPERIRAQPGQQRGGPAEAGQAYGDVQGAAPGVGDIVARARTFPGGLDQIDQRLAYDREHAGHVTVHG